MKNVGSAGRALLDPGLLPEVDSGRAPFGRRLSRSISGAPDPGSGMAIFHETYDLLIAANADRRNSGRRRRAAGQQFQALGRVVAFQLPVQCYTATRSQRSPAASRTTAFRSDCRSSARCVAIWMCCRPHSLSNRPGLSRRSTLREPEMSAPDDIDYSHRRVVNLVGAIALLVLAIIVVVVMNMLDNQRKTQRCVDSGRRIALSYRRRRSRKASSAAN